MTLALFWHVKTPQQMSAVEWESLCDGCGKCCLHKLEDEDDGEVYYTDVACRYLDCQQGSCRDYANRLHNVAECLNLTPHNLSEYSAWLPATCSYVLLARGKPLPLWHPLLSGSKAAMITAGISVAGRVVSEDGFEGDFEERIIHWVDEPLND